MINENIDEDNDLESEDNSLRLSTQTEYPDAIVKISKEQYSIFELKRMLEETKTIIIDPEFQRNFVWKLSQERELIESVLMGIPLPVVYMFEEKDGKKQVVDGRQRITSITRFLNNKFSIEDLKMTPKFNGKKFKDLEPIYQGKIERYQIHAYVIEPPTSERVKYDIFDRVNRGGTTLNNQEMRNALYLGKATKLLKKLSTTDEFKKATGSSIKSDRMKDQYIILRFLAFYLQKTKQFKIEYKSDIDDFLAEAMKFINLLSEEEINSLSNTFIVSMKRIFKILGQNAFRFDAYSKDGYRRPINMPLFEALTYFFAIIEIEQLDAKSLEIQLVALKKDFDESGYFSNRVDSSISVDYRFGEVEKLIKELS